ncbi:MAG: GspE/PulE family protein [Kiritimatiellae bacterium]|nr:GspE/PulE family protein [Kiritimatiellia bacterium]MDD5520217.1 GspE/PulE family protein [Kiritimatiellia bacterium]
MKNDLPFQQPSDTEIVELRKIAREYGVEFIDILADDSLDPVLVAKLPVEWARANYLLPVRIGGEVCVLTADPASVSQQEYLALLIGRDLRPVMASRSLITRSIERCYYSKDDSPDDFLRDLAADNGSVSRTVTTTDDLLQVAEKAPVTQLVNLILLEAVKRNASDIHFEPLEERLRVRYRIDGILYEQASPPKHVEESLVSRLKVMAHMDIAEKRLPQDGMARVRVGEREIDVRVSTIPVAEGERVVLRLLNRDSSLLPLSILGMSDVALRSFESLLHEPNGIIVVSGPTGSGKTTTLYAALGQLDASRKNIMTIEDPIEYQLPNIGQIQVKPKIGLTFATGLRHILRQDPDIVLVGETRDSETASISVRASLTGHLVFTTLHTNDAPSAVLRLVDMGVEPYLLASCLRGILAQRLVRNLCRECRKTAVVQEREIVSFGLSGKNMAGRQVWVPAGCSSCLEGYRGRSGIFELMVLDREMQDIVRTGNAGIDELRNLAEKRGMINLRDDGLKKVLAGITSLTEVMSVAV